MIRINNIGANSPACWGWKMVKMTASCARSGYWQQRLRFTAHWSDPRSREIMLADV